MLPSFARVLPAFALAWTACCLLVPSAQAALQFPAAATLESNGSNIKRGISATTAGDVNGDGYSDVIFSDDGVSTGHGAVYVYLGGPSGNLFDPSRLNFSKTDFNLGPQVAGIGDVNGDGYDDVAVASSNAVYVYYGGPSGITAAGVTTKVITGYISTFYPIHVAPAGDVNGDGYADLAVGLPANGCTGSNSGAFAIYYGGPSGVNFAGGSSVCGLAANYYLGISINTAGDVNADGYADVIVGAPGDGPNGRAYVGSAAGLTTAGRVTLTGDEAFCSFGASVSTAGDINGDGYADVIVGAPAHDYTPASFTDCGAAYVFLGGAGSVSTSSSWFEVGPASNVRFGSSVATAGDLDGDGFADIAVAAPYYSNGQANEGLVGVFAGSAGGIQPSNTFFESNNAGAQLGISLGTAGDVNGDGFSDLIVGAPYLSNPESSEGQVQVFLGAADMPISSGSYYTSYGSTNSSQYGAALSAGGDFNGDGWADMIVGEPGYNTGSGAFGRVSLLLGGPFGPSTSPAAIYTLGSVTNAGAAVSLQGDINGDGIADAVIGLPATSTSNGAVVIFYGNGGAKFIGTTGRAPAVLFPPTTGGHFGAAVTVGDVNGDGFADVIVGSPFSGSNGQVFVYLSPGAAGLSSGAVPALRMTGAQVNCHFGTSVAIAGDVNRDGYLDLLVGSPDYLGKFSTLVGRWSLYRGTSAGPDTLQVRNGIGSGAAPVGSALAGVGDEDGDGYSDFAAGSPVGNQVTLYYGDPNWVRTTATIPAPVAGAFGTALCAAGDMDADGLSDILIGAPATTGSQPGEGRTYLYLGKNLASAAWTKDGGQAGAAWGTSVSAADMSGDGFPDLVGGAPNYDLAGLGLTDAGLAQVFLGNEYGAYRGLVQRNGANNNLVADYGSSGSDTNFWLYGLGRSAAGRTKIRMDWRAERCMFAPLALSGSTGFSDTGAGGLFYGSSVGLSSNVSGLDAGAAYAWSGRYSTNNIYFPRTPWFSSNTGGNHIYDLRTTGSSLAVDLAAPVTELALSAPRPNPARGPMTIACALPRSGNVDVAVLDLQGRRIRTLASGVRAAGRFEVTWDGQDERGGASAPGVYFVRMNSGAEQVMRRVVRLN